MQQHQNSIPGLYGISEKNSSRYEASLWGKNQFNSTFPLALCLYMRDENIDPVSVILEDGRISAMDDRWKMNEIIGKNSDNPYYHFEKSFAPYADFFKDDPENIDLVVSLNDIQSIPLEVKLTVVPDSTTLNKQETKWAPEIVVRPVSSAYAMMGVARSLLKPDNKELKDAVIDILRPVYNSVLSSINAPEITANASWIYDSLRCALSQMDAIQTPFLLQPIWRTKGQSLQLQDPCFDVFVWSDVAVAGILLQEYAVSQEAETLRRSRARDTNRHKYAVSQEAGTTRIQREIARLVRGLYDIMQTGRYDYDNIYKGMPLDSQTDKAFALNGNQSIRYLRHDRLSRPILPHSVLRDLILNGGEYELKPERRFDAAVRDHFKIKWED